MWRFLNAYANEWGLLERSARCLGNEEVLRQQHLRFQTFVDRLLPHLPVPVLEGLCERLTPL